MYFRNAWHERTAVNKLIDCYEECDEDKGDEAR